MQSSQIFNKIDELVKNNDIVLFMKGSAEIPLCGFSARVVAILKHLHLDFVDVDIFKEEGMRQGIKDYTDWPTVPQLYIKGVFIGGCDIVRDMFDKGELQKLLKEKSLIS